MKLLIMVIMMISLATSVMGREFFYENDNLGLVKIDVKESVLEKVFNTQSLLITSEKKSVVLGEQAKIRIITEVPCQDANGNEIQQISSAKFVVNDPAGTTTNFDILGKVGVCQSNQLEFTLTPQKIGKYSIHYIVMQKNYPQILVKEVSDFTVVSGSPQCQAEELSEWKFLYDMTGGKVYNRFKYAYDQDCTLIPSAQVTYYKTQCNSGYLIEQSEQALSEGIKKCSLIVEKQVIDSDEKITEMQPNPIQEIKCTQDIIAPCGDLVRVEYACVEGILIPIEDFCPEQPPKEGSQNKIPTLTLLFSPDFYGIYTISLLGLTSIAGALYYKKRR